MTEYRIVRGFENYGITREGNIKNLISGRPVK